MGKEKGTVVMSRAQPGPDVKPTGTSHRCIILGSVCFLATSQKEHATIPGIFFFSESRVCFSGKAAHPAFTTLLAPSHISSRNV